MNPRWALVVVALAALVSSCSKEKAESSTPTAAVDHASAESPGEATASVDPAASLASLESELAARKAELSARGLSFGDQGGATTPPATPVDRETMSPDATSPSTTSPKNEPPENKPTTRRSVKQSKRKKGKHGSKDLAKKKPDDASDTCAPICGPADAICDLSARICGLADEHEEEERYTAACERAENDCARAAEACEECRG